MAPALRRGANRSNLRGVDLLISLGIGLLIMTARMVDVAIGTLRVISVVDGRLKTSFVLGFVEVLIWVSVISLTLKEIDDNPWLAVFFALGFSLGNVVGIVVERRLPLGNLTLRAVGGEEIRDLAARLREFGVGATVLKGEGHRGERFMLYSFMPKSTLRKVRHLLESVKNEVFYTLDYGGTSNRVLLPAGLQPSSPRRFFKRK
jgi:uncharacterized protein YebE (UPF0316 family)